MTALTKTLSFLAMLLVAVLSFAFIVQTHDPVALLGWMFCVAIGVSTSAPVRPPVHHHEMA